MSVVEAMLNWRQRIMLVLFVLVCACKQSPRESNVVKRGPKCYDVQCYKYAPRHVEVPCPERSGQ